MSYIAVDLKVVEVLAPAVSRAAGVPEDRVLAGLVRLWHRCWSTESVLVTRFDLAGCFGPEGLDSLIAALVEDFLEPTDGGFRVRGAARYLRLRDALRRGGKKAAKNLRRGGKTPGSRAGDQPGGSRGGAGAVSRLSPGPPPSTEHRTPNTEEKLSAPASRSPETDPRHAPLVKALTEAYQDELGAKYGFTGRDAKHVSQLLALGPPEEVEARWRLALQRSRDKFQSGKVRRLSDLVTHWNEYPMKLEGAA